MKIRRLPLAPTRIGILIVTVLAVGGGAVMADTPTAAEMDAYVAKMAAQDLEILRNLKPREVWVAADGKPTNSGAKDSPVDLKTAYTTPALVTPGTVVWIQAGQYDYTQGGLMSSGICGTREKPIIFRSVPGARVTLHAQVSSNKGCDHIWWWGVEITGTNGCGVETREGGDGLKFINLFIHDKRMVPRPPERVPTVMGIAGWDCGDDHEFYGNIVFRNGEYTLDHGFYSQNEAEHTAKRYVDNIVFENRGQGFQIYGSAPTLRNIYVEGNIAFCTGFPGAPHPGMNILIGGEKNPTTCVIVRDNCTYHHSPASKRGVDIGYRAGPNTQIRVENNYFTGGANAMELNLVAEAMVRGNTFWAPHGMVVLTTAAPPKPVEKITLPDPSASAGDTEVDPELEPEPQDSEKTRPAKSPSVEPARPVVVFESNTYIGNGRFDLDRFRKETGTGQSDRLVAGKDGRPVGLHVFKRVNRYEPNRVHLAVYNWSRAEAVALDLNDVLKKGEMFRIVEVHDLWATPALQAYTKAVLLISNSAAPTRRSSGATCSSVTNRAKRNQYRPQRRESDTADKEISRTTKKEDLCADQA